MKEKKEKDKIQRSVNAVRKNKKNVAPLVELWRSSMAAEKYKFKKYLEFHFIHIKINGNQNSIS